MTTASLILCAAGLLFPRSAYAAKASAPADGGTILAELKSSGVDKKRFEAYVARRVRKINERHKSRLDFMAKESDIWSSFWTKIRDDRKVFEIRITRQMLDLFDSLSSLDANDHASSISDFEKMQGNVVKSFETQQKQKLAEFFAARERRWREFVSQQEREHGEFLAEAPADWKATRGAEGNSPKRTKASRPSKNAPPPEETGGDDSEASVSEAPSDAGGRVPSIPKTKSSPKAQKHDDPWH